MSALEYSPVVVPFGRGLGLDMDARMRPPERLEVAENVYAAVTNRQEKRKGYTRLGRNRFSGIQINDNGPIRAIAACGDELLAIGHRDLFGYIASQDKWAERGHVSPLVGRARPVWRSHGNYESGDVAISSSYLVRAASRVEQLAGAEGAASPGIRYSLSYEVLDLVDVVAKARAEYETTSTASSKPRSPRLVGNSWGVAMFYGRGNGGAAGTLRYCRLSDSTAVTVGFGSATTITADLFQPATGGTVARTWDACAVTSGANYDQFLSYIDTTNQDANLRGYNSSGTQTQSSTIAGTFYRCAVAQDGAGAANVYVLVASTAEQDQLLLYARRRSDLSAVWGPITISTAPVGTTFDNLGVVEGIDTNGLTRVVCTWLVYSSIINDGANVKVYTATAAVFTNGTSLSTEKVAWNCLATSRPFFYRNRVYQEATVWMLAAGFCARMLVDLGNPDIETETMLLAAMYDVGEANVANAFGLVGSCNTIAAMPDGVSFRHAIGTMVEADSPTDTTPRVAIDEAAYTFDVAPTVASLPGPAAIVGGGYCAYYDGSRTFEMGFGAPPVIDSSTSAAIAGGMSPGTYTLILHWAHVDARGALHRSLPSPPRTLTIPGDPLNPADYREIEVEWRTLPCSRRPAREMTASYFRAGSDGIAYRRWGLGKIAPNQPTQFLGDPFDDNNAVTQSLVQLYTTGGVLEAVAPEGARIPLMTRERLWLGGFFRADRVQYSKTMTPNTSGDQVVAPEMMEALGRLIPTGEQVTGLGELGQETAIFTQRTIYLVAGEGPDARGASDNMSRMAALSCDDGCADPRSVASFSGGVVFRGRRGFVLLTQGQTVKPIGEAIRSTVDLYPNTTSACVVPSEDQIRFTVDDGSTGKILVWDYLRDEWFTWTIRTNDAVAIKPVGGVVVAGVHYVLDSNGYTWKQSPTAYYDNDGSNEYIPQDIKTAWVQPMGPGQYYRLGRIALTLDKQSDHNLVVKLYTDYDATTPKITWTLTSSQIAALADPANREQFLFKVGGSYAKATAYMLEVTETDPGTGSGAGFRALAATFFIAGLGPARVGSQAQV